MDHEPNASSAPRLDLKETGVGALLDLNFTKFITVQLVKVIYIIGLVLVTIVALSIVVSGFRAGFMFGVGALFLAPMLWVLWILGLRVYCELIVALFRIAENTTTMVERIPKP